MAEGIKISEMEQVTTLEEGCCFPVVSNGVNKKITQKNLYKLMTENLQSSKVNYKLTAMIDLGFTVGSINSIRDFWSKLVSTVGSNGVIQFKKNPSWSAKVGDSSNNIDINGGTLIFTASTTPTISWSSFSAIYYNSFNKDVYYIQCSIEADVTTGKEKWSINKLSTIEDIANLQNQIIDLDNDVNFKLETNRTSFRALGFESGSTVSVYDLWESLFNAYKCKNNVNLANGCLDVMWSSAESGYISFDGSETNKILFNGGMLIFTCGKILPWGSFTALYLNNYLNRYFVIKCNIGETMDKINPLIMELSTTEHVLQLQSQIDSNDTDITDLQSQIDNNKTDLQSQIDSNDKDITDLQNQIDNNKTDLQNQIDNKVNIEDLFLNNSSMTVQATTNTILLNFYKPDDSYAGALEIDTDEENPSINFRLGPSNYLVSTKNMNILIQSAFQEINSLKERVSQLEGK